jgi:DNA-binding NarL/FixJ family response regulator
VRIVIAEDSALIREGLAGFLEDRGHDVVARVGDAEALVEAARRLGPQAVITDLRMPPGYGDEGVDAAVRIRGFAPRIGILVLSQHLDTTAAVRLVSIGDGIGYLLKDRVLDVDEFLAALERVAAGGVALDPGIVRILVRGPVAADPLASLTRRERDVLELMSDGRSNAAIADTLVLTERTIETHIGSIFAKLGILASDRDNRRVRAVIAYLAAPARR